MYKVILCLGLCLVVMGCQARKNQIAFDGQFFRATAKKVGSDRRELAVSVRPVSASVTGAQEAGRHASARYCIENYGSSEVNWAIGPDDDPDSYVLDGDTLVLRGTCAG